jgi:anti-sigma regulatory factor (Ser/Thr protein kinase)
VHEMLLYRGEADFHASVQVFLQDAAAAAEPVLVALSGSHLERVREECGDAGAEARFEDIEAVGRNPSQLLPMIEDWVRSHDGHARVLTESVWPGRTYAETVECLRHEALINHVLADSSATILCPYDAERLDAETLAGAEMTHPTVMEGGHRRPSRCYGDPVTVQQAEQWPQEPPPAVASEYPFDGSLIDLRHAVAEDPALEALSDERRFDLVFAVNEAATNAVQHGDQDLTTRIWHDGHGVVSEVSSDAALDDLWAFRHRPEPEATSGRGLWLINQLCDLVELRSGQSGTTVRMHVSDH